MNACWSNQYTGNRVSGETWCTNQARSSSEPQESCSWTKSALKPHSSLLYTKLNMLTPHRSALKATASLRQLCWALHSIFYKPLSPSFSPSPSPSPSPFPSPNILCSLQQHPTPRKGLASAERLLIIHEQKVLTSSCRQQVLQQLA